MAAEYKAGKRTSSGYLAVPANDGKGPGVLVLHAWWGLNDFFLQLCDRLAQEGFVALAPDLYGGAVTASIQEAEALMNAKTADKAAVQRKVLDGLEALQSQSSLKRRQVAVAAFSLGAFWGMHLCGIRPDDIAAIVSFYGLAPFDSKSFRACYLGHFGEKDSFEPIEDVREMEKSFREAGKDAAIYVYPGAGHWFCESNRPDAYDAKAAELAWARTVMFLRKHV